jgi:hypothetical protein
MKKSDAERQIPPVLSQMCNLDCKKNGRNEHKKGTFGGRRDMVNGGKNMIEAHCMHI